MTKLRSRRRNVRGWGYDDRTDRSAIQSDIRDRIDERFPGKDIVIAFPQRDDHRDVTNSTHAPEVPAGPAAKLA